MEFHMPSPRNSKLAYNTENMIWNAAVNHGIVRYRTQTKEQCTMIIQRLHYYRKLDRLDSKDGIQSTLDEYTIQRLDDTTLRIKKRELNGILTTDDGTRIDLDELQKQMDQEADYALTQQGLDVSYLPNTKKPLIDMD